MARQSQVVALVTMVALAACGGTSESAARVDPAPDPGEAAPAAAPAVSLADRVEVDDVAILQGTTATLVTDAKPAKKRNAPVIAGRPGLVRVHARLTDSTARLPKLAAELRIVTAGKDDIVLRDVAKSLVERDDADLDTTFDFELDADALAPGSTLSAAVFDPSAPDDRAKFPTDDTSFAIGARDDAPTLRVRFVPVRYDGDGSGRLPGLDATTLETHRRALYSMYPARKVEIDVRAPLPWPSAVDATGNGWDELLNAIIDARHNDAVDDDVFYVGVFIPKPTIDDYCANGGCILGVAPAAQLNEVGLRVAMVVGYDSYAAEGTLAQELAHAMGREHAPCGGPDGPDPKYPYVHAAIGVAGWNILDKTLVDPNGRSKDFMSYCDPVWVSDYTYSGLYDRMAAVAKTDRKGAGGGPIGTGSGAGGSEATKARVRSYQVKADGSLVEGALVDVVSSTLSTSSNAISMRYEDAAGRTLAVSNAAYRRFDSMPGGLLLAPEAPVGAIRARVNGLSVRPLELKRPN